MLFACVFMIQTSYSQQTIESTEVTKIAESSTITTTTEWETSATENTTSDVKTTDSDSGDKSTLNSFSSKDGLNSSPVDEVEDNNLSEDEENNYKTSCDKCKQNPEILGLKHQIINDTIKIQWDPIEETELNCQYKYTTKINEFNDYLDFTRFANTTGVDIPIKDLCGIHTVNILASNICGNEVNQTISIVIPAKSFKISMEKINSNKTQIKITTNCNSNSSSLQISCDSGYNKTFTNVQDTDVKTLDGLKAFTNHSCRGELFKDNNSVGNASFTFQTEQSAPSKVRNITVSNITDSSFEINWESPKNVRGILTNYTITLEGRPLYNPPVFCQDLYKNIKIGPVSVSADVKTHVFQNLSGNYEFNITIKAKTSKFGPLESITTKTSTPSPGEVENLNKFIDASKINQPKAQISWSYPCATYTSVNRVVFSIHIAENSKTTERINETMNIDNPQQNFTIDQELKPSTNYTIMVYTINLDTSQISTANSLQFESPEGVTSPPLFLSSEIDSFMIDMYWQKPTYVFGDLVSYKVNITSFGPLHKLGCDEVYLDNTLLLETNSTHISQSVKPNHKYSVEITTNTTRMVGETLKYEFSTKPFQSEPVLNLICNATENSSNGSAGLRIQFEPPCNTNGVFDYYSITVFDEQGSKVFEHRDNSTFFEISDMKYESTYRVDVNVVTKGDLKSRDEFCDVKTKSDKPNPPNLNKSEVIAHIYDKQVEVMLRDDYFDNSHGEVKFFALLVGLATKWETKNNLDSGYWDGIKWPNDEFWNEEGLPYQATPAKWQPLKGTIQKFIFKLGTQNCTGKNNEFCNGPLTPNTEYVLAIRGYTTNGYQISNKLRFVTQDLEKTQNVVMIIGIVAGVLLIIIISSLACVYWKRRPNKPISLEEANQIVHNQVIEFIPPCSVKIEEFPAYYNERKFKLNEEYESLQNIGGDYERTIGSQAENRKKNRYINILPYNSSRVCLEGCESDYINASYIKGYSGEVEYIATQGPLESTVADFWMMVVNENCSVVAMVAQFEEQKKIKCHRYFPDCREQMELYLDDGGEMMVRCSYALNFDYYIERQIIVQVNKKQVAVTHLQFLNWPDFGCPEGTTNMLQFTKRLRRHMQVNNSKAVVHCSAGVGRTGTLVAVDILLQTIRDGKDIDIYGTVVALRHQRMKMVQAESQYLYIYQCILDEILQPVELTEIKPLDPIYENMENLIEMKVISKQNNNCDTQIEFFNEVNQATDENEGKTNKSLDDEQNKINNAKSMNIEDT